MRNAESPSYYRHCWRFVRPLLRSFVQTAEICRPTRDIKMKDAHSKAARKSSRQLLPLSHGGAVERLTKFRANERESRRHQPAAA
jgi:hypothetical protein